MVQHLMHDTACHYRSIQLRPNRIIINNMNLMNVLKEHLTLKQEAIIKN